MAGRWICPHCEHASYLTDMMSTSGKATVAIENKEGPLATLTFFEVCPNPECQRTTVTLMWGPISFVGPQGHIRWNVPPHSIRLSPPSYARSLSGSVPAPIVEDYREACAILDLSPKAAATLARRALQGMIRDFHKIVKRTLNQEIIALRDVVDPDLWEAIDAVRGVGNIGAHMEADINLIVDVDPGEALKLVRLIELLSLEWYATRENRKRQLSELKELGAQKQEERKRLQPGEVDGEPPVGESSE